MFQPWDAPEASASRAAVNWSYQYFRFYPDVVDERVQIGHGFLIQELPTKRKDLEITGVQFWASS